MKKYVIAIIGALILLGIAVGFYNRVDLTNVVGLSFTFKYFIYLSLICICGIFLSFVGIPLFLLLLISELLTLGILLFSFAFSFGTKGVLFLLTFTLLFKVIYWFCLLLLSFYSFKLIKNNYLYLFKRFSEYKRNSKLYLKKSLIICSLMLVFNLIVVLFGDKVVIPVSSYLLW